ncbi:hypothetical protein Axi01nite_23260 [Actinoplanes xinjiangensis]|nr:hypothetical protein Axi01nite_23260 [Actinoplanes xinjiangensis]
MLLQAEVAARDAARATDARTRKFLDTSASPFYRARYRAAKVSICCCGQHTTLAREFHAAVRNGCVTLPVTEEVAKPSEEAFRFHVP